ncbi:MAG: hypothetical protein NZ602_13485 [Thermoguttaceae bacterium]|nr:hypothetical protein [Thermoguttaceae bacterium]MDW8038183.1 hypothetical protein [Thermoguttaceae bacterium]
MSKSSPDCGQLFSRAKQILNAHCTDGTTAKPAGTTEVVIARTGETFSVGFCS